MELSPFLDPQYLAAAEMMIDNEDFQNFQINPLLKERVMAGIPCDFLIDDLETFGRTLENPIPVNGPYGEHTYLSRLRTLSGLGFFYHRLGSIDTVDEYEILSYDGSVREVLYFDMYHPRRSRQAVKGYLLIEEPQAWTGFSHRLANFPDDFLDEHFSAEQMTLFMPSLHALYKWLESTNPCVSNHAYCEHGSDMILDGGSHWDPPVEEEDLGGPFPIFTWRDHISESEIEEANELHGYIIKTEGELTVEGEKFGWYPSKALAKRRKLDLYLMYDPAVIVLLEGFDVYRSLAPSSNSPSMNFTPKQVRFDKQGFFSTLEFDGYPQCEDFVDFLSNFYLPKRTYQMKVEKTALKDTFYVRWFSDVVGSYKVEICDWKPLNESKLIAEFDDVGNLTFKF